MNLDDARAILADSIDDLRNQRSTPAAVNAISNAMGKYLHTYRLQIEYATMLGEKHRIAALDEAQHEGP